MFCGACRGFDGDGTQGCGAALREDDAVDACTVCRAQKRAEVLGIFDTIECKQEAGIGGGVAGCGEDIFKREKFAFANDCDDTLMAGCFGHARELIAILKTYAHTLLAAEVDDALQFLRRAALLPLAADTDMIETAIAGPQGLFYRVQPK